MENPSAAEAAKRWGITSRRVRVLCKSERVERAVYNGTRLISSVAEKPEDPGHIRKAHTAKKPFRAENCVKKGGKNMEQVKKFLEALRTDPRAKELLGEIDPENREEILQLYTGAAGALGFTLTAEEIEEGIIALTEEMKEKTEAAENDITEIDLEELERVAGGGGCKETYDPNENCLYVDRCESLVGCYTGEKDCKAVYNCDYVLL